VTSKSGNVYSEMWLFARGDRSTIIWHLLSMLSDLPANCNHGN